MSTRSVRLAAVTALLAGVILRPQPSTGHGTVDTSDMVRTHREVRVDKREPVRLEVEFDAGHLDVRRGSKNGVVVLDLFQATEVDSPVIEHDTRPGHERLRVASGDWKFEEGGHIRISGNDDDGDDDDDIYVDSDKPRRSWVIELPPDVPFNIVLAAGASRADLDLSGVRLHDLHLATGAGEMELRFNAPNPAAGGILEIQGGACKFSAFGLGNARFRSISFAGGVGDFLLDFAGASDRDTRAEFELGLGKLRLELPASLGVKLDMSDGGLNQVNVEGLERRGDSYISGDYSGARYRLAAHITAGLGIVEVAVED